MLILEAKNRVSGETLETIRKNNCIPAVFYGYKVDSTPITVETTKFIKILKGAGESTTVTLKTDAGDKEVLIHDVQYDAIKNTPIHVDFLVVDANKEIEVGVPIEFTGESAAVKAGLGSLVKVMHEVEVKALPKNLPHSIIVDISPLATLDDNIFVSNLVVPPGVTIITDGGEVVAAVVAQKEEKEEVPVDLSAIEVEQKGKKEEEGAEGGEEKVTE